MNRKCTTLAIQISHIIQKRMFDYSKTWTGREKNHFKRFKLVRHTNYIDIMDILTAPDQIRHFTK